MGIDEGSPEVIDIEVMMENCPIVLLYGKYLPVAHIMLCVMRFLPIHSGHQFRWTYQPGSHRRKVTQDFSSTFFLRCVP